MRITEEDLDLSLVNKINQLEKLKSETSDSTTYITYENGEFVKKNLNVLNLNKIINTDDIYNLSKHLYKSEDNYVSGYDTSIVESTMSYATSSLLTSLNGSFLFQTDANIVKIKTYATHIYVLDKNGVMYKISRTNPSIQTSKNVLEIIKMNYVYQNFDVYSIIDFDAYSDGVLIATEYNGIFFISLEREESSIAVQELYVSKIKVLSDRKTLLITKDQEKQNVILFNLELGVKLASFNQLGKDFQIAQNIDIEENEFFILGKSIGVNQSDSLLHHWKLDSAGVEYVNLDREIAKNPCDNIYRPKLIKSDSSLVYVIGTKEHTLFVWEYDKSNLNTTPTELLFNLQEFSYDDIKDFVNIAGRYYITLKDQILVLDNKFTLLENYKLFGAGVFSSAKITPSGVYAVDGKSCFSFHIPKKIYTKINDVQILKGGEPCNNIDIMVQAPVADQIIFIDGDTSQKINPYYYIKLDNKFHIIKLMNINSKNIIMRVGVYEEDKIYGVVIHKNRVFYK